MISKTNIVGQFREAVARLRKDIPNALLSELNRIERNFGELRQINTTLSRNLEQVKAVIPAAEKEAQQAKADAQQQSQNAASLAQKLANKEQEVSRLQKALSDTEALLVEQRAKGFNVEMLKDFFDQLEMDLQCAIEENEDKDTTSTQHPCQQKLRYFFQRYGQFGGFVPQTALVRQGERTEPSEASFRQLVADLGLQNRQIYHAELEHLHALSRRLAFALECCQRPDQQFVRTFHVNSDGSIEPNEAWEDIGTIHKRLRRWQIVCDPRKANHG